MSSLPPRSLFTQLVDDAAVFPPGNFSLSEAIDRRSARRGTPASDFVGPLLLPPKLIDEALTDHRGLVIGVIGRRDTPIGQVVSAARRVADSPGHALAGIEIAAVPGWDAVLELAVPVAVEVPAGPDGTAQLAGIGARDGQVIAKLRTQSTAATPVPSAADVAAFITECLRVRMSFKLTGGLHHAIAHTVDGEEQHGFLNVLLATHAALCGDADITGHLLQRDATTITTAVHALTEADAVNTRNVFTSFGCCDVLDPIDDLAYLGLIPGRTTA